MKFQLLTSLIFIASSSLVAAAPLEERAAPPVPYFSGFNLGANRVCSLMPHMFLDSFLTEFNNSPMAAARPKLTGSKNSGNSSHGPQTLGTSSTPSRYSQPATVTALPTPFLLQSQPIQLSGLVSGLQLRLNSRQRRLHSRLNSRST